jgi:hypothetical protein
MRSKTLLLLPLISLPLAAGCIRTQTVLIQPGQPIRLLSPVTVAGKTTATEVAKNQWIVNDAPVTLPAGAYVVVLPAVSNVEPPAATTQPQTQP